jgi:predicted site-specific integrase-resolvase
MLPNQPPGMPPPPANSQFPNQQQFQTTNEELIEAIIDEKWNDLIKDITKIIEWKAIADSKLVSMQQEIKDMRNEFDKLHQAIIGKVGEYDQHILDVGAELKAMEKVFAKVLPVFTENVSELSRITDTLKQQ